MNPNSFDLTGQVAVVTGGNGGIGRAIVLGLASAGSAVALLCRNAEKNAAVLAELRAFKVPAIALPVDVSDGAPVFGAFAVLWLRRVVLGWFLPPYLVQIENDVYSQIGLVMLIGLAAKNAILIVEFAKSEFDNGKPLVDAALEGARLRLRPILMTSFAFVFGCIPLWTASGAGAVARRILGTTVIGGMVAASAIGIFFVPAFFYAVEKWFSSGRQPGPAHYRLLHLPQEIEHALSRQNQKLDRHRAVFRFSERLQEGA